MNCNDDFKNNTDLAATGRPTGMLRWLLALVASAGLSMGAIAQDAVDVSLGSVTVFNDATAEVAFNVTGNAESRGLQLRFDYDPTHILSVDLADCLSGFIGVGQIGTLCSQPADPPGRIRVLMNAGPGEVINDFTGLIRFELDGSLAEGEQIALLWDSVFAAATNLDATTSQTDGVITSGGQPPGVLALAPASIDFGGVPFGATVQEFVTVSNSGSPSTESLEISSFGISGSGSGFDVIGGTCTVGTILAPQGAGCTIAVEFAPFVTGNYSATLDVATTDAQSESTDLLGEGTPAPATIEFADLVQTYTGDPLEPTISTDPAGLNVIVTYNGLTSAPTNAGGYFVEVSIDEPDYFGSASANFVIDPATAEVQFADLTQAYTGDPLEPTITTVPEGLSVGVTYDSFAVAPTDVGSYSVEVTVNEANYIGNGSETFVIEQATATIEFADLTQTYTGDPLEPTITTVPEGLNIVVTYDSQPDAPTNAGSYSVEVTIEDVNYSANASETFVIDPAQAMIEITDLVQLETGAPLQPTITTDPEGLNIVVSYDEQPEPPTEIGVYLVEVKVVDEDNYTGWNSALFRIVGDEIHRDRFEEQPVQAGDTFTDCPDCPTMVVIPGGTFTQGAPKSEPQSSNFERPQRTVNVPAFAMGRHAVTFDEWDACVADGGCTYTPSDNWGRGDQPVINVSWNDAQQYVTWLSNKNGQDYRLPSESEWEYATRAGTTGRFNTGDCITTDQANFDGNSPATGCPTGIYRGETLPVGSFAPNAFGLYDTHGNTWEWVQDCWNASYNGAPTNGSAWMTGNCSGAVLRGGSWINFGGFVRSAIRGWFTRGGRSFDYGFRVARSVAL